MKLENQVCSIEQAERLAILGVNHPDDECIAYGYLLVENEDYVTKIGLVHSHGNAVSCTPLFTVAELGAMLPASIRTNSAINGADIVVRKDYDTYTVAYDKDVATEGGYGPTVKEIHNNIRSEHKSFAEAMADMLIWLLTQNLTDASECNERLRNS